MENYDQWPAGSCQYLWRTFSSRVVSCSVPVPAVGVRSNCWFEASGWSEDRAQVRLPVAYP
jgi:hypothetical protein